MKKIIGTFILLISLALLPLPGFPQAGTLDDTFSDDGIDILSLSPEDDWAEDIVAFSDSILFVCGGVEINGVTSGFIMRLLNNGEPDMAFGTEGRIDIQYGVFTQANDLIILPDNKIVVSGYTQVTSDDQEFFIAKYLPDGSPDLTFNSTGYFISPYSSDWEYNYAMTMQADGKFVLAGKTYTGGDLLFFMRVNTNGTIDNSFGTNGYTTINIPGATDVKILDLGVLSNGTIVGVGRKTVDYYDVILVKLTASGNPMPGFGTNGVMTPEVFNNYSDLWASALIVRNDSLLVTGSLKESKFETFLANLDSSGNAITGFGTDGITIPDIGLDHFGRAIFRQPDGKLYVCGYSGIPYHLDFILWRFMPDGNLDYSFNNTGYVITSVSSDNDVANSIDMQPCGKIVHAGYTIDVGLNNQDVALICYLNDWRPPGCYADFSADPPIACKGEQVSFTDLTFSTDSVAVSWQWTFEGGTPAASTAQSPVITYNGNGANNVQLIVSDGIYTDTLLRTDYINVESIPVAPVAPAGPTELCGTYSYNYITTGVSYANGYNWQVIPSDAGTITGDSTSAVFLASPSWTGSFTIQVDAEGLCGTGPWSAALQCDLHHNPSSFQLSGSGDGGFCEGEPGSELTLDGSDNGVDYELYLAGAGTGNIVAGTGSAISFGFINVTGLYTIYGYTDYCSEFMTGQVYVHQWGTPGEAEIPIGPEETCNNESSIYTSGEIEEADWYAWTLDPAEAGELTPVNDSVTITWDSGFSGTASLSVHGENDCGTGPESDPLIITVELSPDPSISGPQIVDSGFEEEYQTEDHPGNSYTWEVTGGTVTYGAGTHQVTVLWGDPGDGAVFVTEVSAEGCSSATDPYPVTIDEFINIDETHPGNMMIYPNPANEAVNISIHSRRVDDVKIQITSMEGKVVYSSTMKMLEGDNLLQVNTRFMPEGMYIFREMNTDTIKTSRMIIVH